MCGGGGGASEDIARRAEQQENERQARIAQGMKQIEAMFGGGRVGMNHVAPGTALDFNKTYYDAVGNPINLAAQQAQAGQWGAIADAGWGDNPYLVAPEGYYADAGTTEGFGKDYYDKVYNAQLDYALPQVDQQFEKAQKELEYALARQGISASSQGAARQADLQGQRALAIQDQQANAQKVRQSQEQAVEQERSNLVQMLQNTGDLTSTVNTARTRADMLSQTPPLETVGPLFQNVTAGLADLVVSPALRNNNAGLQTGGYGQSSKGSGKVIGG